MRSRGFVIENSLKHRGLTLLKTMVLVAVLGLLATAAASLWLRYKETVAPAASGSQPVEAEAGRPAE